MSKDDHIHLFAKYSAVLQWLQEISPQGIASSYFYKELINSAKDYTMKNTGCSQEKIDRIASFGFNSLIYDSRDQSIVDCFFEYLDDVRKARQ